jgi:hypothetical protein
VALWNFGKEETTLKMEDEVSSPERMGRQLFRTPELPRPEKL